MDRIHLNYLFSKIYNDQIRLEAVAPYIPNLPLKLVIHTRHSLFEAVFGTARPAAQSDFTSRPFDGKIVLTGPAF